jgi:response regulator RpfG family c-di-GMP phosphodiesterase
LEKPGLNSMRTVSTVKCALVVDDEPMLREILSDLLKERGYTVLEAENGQEALSIFADHKEISVVFSDIRMPVMDGVTLFSHLKKGSPHLPFILMTGYSDIMDMESAYQMGVTEFLTKPYSSDDVNSSVDLVEHMQAGRSSSSDGSVDGDQEYCRVFIDEFVSGSKALSDVFLKVGANKYIRVGRKESPISIERVNNYKSKGLQYLFLRKQDFASYVGMNLALSKAISKQNVPKHKKLKVLNHTLETLVQDVHINGIDKDKFQDAKGLMEATLNLVVEQEELFSLLDMIKGHSVSAYTHSLAVSMYAVAVCNHWGWRSTMVLNKVSLAGLFHDIGLKEMSDDLIQKSRVQMTMEELKLYQTHPTRGAALLLQISGIPEDVVAVALQHHENMLGTGYPHSLNRSRIHPLAKIIGTVDRFIELLAIGKRSEVGDPSLVLNQMHTVMKDEVDLQTLKALMEIFSVPIPKDMRGLSSRSMITN